MSEHDAFEAQPDERHHKRGRRQARADLSRWRAARGGPRGRTHASWLNLVERFFGLLTEHALRRASHTSTGQLRVASDEYLAAHNEEPKPFKWTKNADEILDSIARFATRTLRAHREP